MKRTILLSAGFAVILFAFRQCAGVEKQEVKRDIIVSVEECEYVTHK